MRTSRSLGLFLAGLTLATAAGCGSGEDLGTGPGSGPGSASSAVASVTVTPPTATIRVGGTVQLTGTPRNAAGSSLPNPVTWTSSNTLVATVSTTGLVTGVATGQVSISATSDTKTGTATITVTAPLLVVSGAGIGTGKVTASPPGLSGAIDCTINPGETSGTCYTPYASGTVVTLTATPLDFPPFVGSSAFVGWGGACFGFGTGSCQVTMTQDRSVSAIFQRSGVPTQIAARSPTSQTGIVGQPVAVPPSVLVQDANNLPAPGVPVHFSVTLGGGSIGRRGGSIGPESVDTTDSHGIASVGQWILGPTPGTENNTVTAGVAFPYGWIVRNNEVIFKASANPE